MADKDILSELKQSILDFDEDAALELAQESLAQGIDPVEAVGVLADGLNELGVKFERMEVFLPEIMLASDAFKNALSVLEPEIKKKNTEGKKAIPIVIGTVQGDIHQVGKDMVATFLATAGFEVYDLGVDVAPSRFLEEAKRLGAKVIAAASLMSTTRPVQKDLIDFLEAKGVRDQFIVLVGGGVVTQEWADQIAADGYGQDAIATVNLAKRLLHVA
ncbi:MAG: cobalamin-binding protein [Selenomonas ruminantium]|uniref:Cobalamin-binding protein n=1 Tax=Selenomonas ruminantium TaxID=971 RepID=A0A1H0TKM4_SELRU|nr:cobalamin-dependent protein [Selenomonas ruminantium]MBE6084674.1 cobalamin-binding protein [Selenomonas ruminantium]SDP54549.1 trimethylamine corrinoid protein [Selenomonas ruminantium]